VITIKYRLTFLALPVRSRQSYLVSTLPALATDATALKAIGFLLDPAAVLFQQIFLPSRACLFLCDLRVHFSFLEWLRSMDSSVASGEFKDLTKFYSIL
jgi:hypothetical protein